MSVSSLTNLCEDLKVTLSESSSSLAEVGALTAEILCKSIIVLSFRCLGRCWVLCLELAETVLARVYVGEEVVVVVEEVYTIDEYNPYDLPHLALTQLGNIRQTLHGRLSGFLELFG